MKSALKVLLAVIMISLRFASQANAVTVYYQPTPYPLKKCEGSASCPGGAMPQDLNIVHIWDGWMNSYYDSIKPFQRDDKLQTGGWGDVYNSYIRFDLTGLPSGVTQAALWPMPYPRGDNSTPTGVDFWWPSASWNATTMTWDNQPAIQYPQDYLGGRSAPVANQWWGTAITSTYNSWKNGTRPNNGFRLEPWLKNNNFNVFRSSRYKDFVNDPYADGKRPILGLTFTPTLELKMPLPGGAKWLLTNEVGGYECMGETPWPDTAHQGSNYFSIDISPTNVKDGGGSYAGNIPIIAAASGKVFIGYTDANGNYAVIDHDGDGLFSTGYQTRYLHMQSNFAVTNGQTVSQGDLLGYMGNTGNPTTGTHLHFGVRYQDSGSSTVSQLSSVVMDGLILKSYQTECSMDGNGVPTGRIRYYHSSNRAY